MRREPATLHQVVATTLIVMVAIGDVIRPSGLSPSILYVAPILYLAWFVPGRTVWYFAAGVACLVFVVPLATGRSVINRVDDVPLYTALVYLIWDRQRYARAVAATNVTMSSRIDEQIATLQGLNDDLTRQIDERSQIEASLRDSEARYRNLVELSPDAILVMQDERLVFANNAAARIVGAPSAEELLGRKLIEVIDPAQHATHIARTHALQTTGQMLPPQEYRVQRMDGTWTYVEVLAGACRFHKRDAIQIVVRDLTDSKRLASSLRKLSDFREKVIATAAEGICVCSKLPDFPYVHFSIWNDRMAELTGYTAEEVNRLGWIGAMHPDSQAQKESADRFARMWSGGDLRAELRTITRKDGHQRILSISTSKTELEDGQVAVIALAHDVTEQTLNDERLRQSESSFRGLVEAIPDLIFRVDPQGHVNYVKSEPAEDLLMPAEVIRGQRFHDYLPHAVAEGFDAAIARAKLSEGVESFDYGLDLPDGRRQSFEARIVGIVDGGAVVVARNVTKQQRAGQELAIAHDRTTVLAQLTKELNDCTTPRAASLLLLETARQLIDWDSSWIQLWNAQQHAFEGLVEFDLFDGKRREVPQKRDERRSLTPIMQRVMREGPVLVLRESETDQIEGFRLVGNQRRSLSMMYVPIRHGERFVGALSIQSYRKQAYDEAALKLLQLLSSHCAGALARIQTTEALQEGEKRYRRLLDELPVGVFVHDGMQFYYANPRALQILGVPDCTGLFKRSPIECIAPEFRDMARQRVDSMLKSGDVPPPVEAAVLRQDGTRVDVEVNSRPTRFSDHDCVQVLFQDITERKQSENSLRESELRFRQMAENIREVFWLATPDNRKIIYVSPAYEELVGRSCASLYANPRS